MVIRQKHFLPYKGYVVCNLLLVLIPVLALVTVFLVNMHEQLLNEVLDMRQVNLSRTQEEIDQTLENYGAMVLYAAMDPDLRPYQLRQYDYAAMTALNHLKQHASSLSEMSIYFHIYSDDCLYSPDGRLSFDTFERLYSFEGDWTADDFYQMLYSSEPYMISPAGCELMSRERNAHRYITVLYPWRYNGINYGTSIGLIRSDWLEIRLHGKENDRIYLLDADGTPIIGGPETLPFAPDVVDDHAESVHIDGELYHLVWQGSGLTGWQYLTIVSEAHIRSLLFGGHTLMFTIFLAIALAFSTVGVMLAVRYYSPVQSLDQILQTQPGEMRPVHDRVSNILRSNENMRMELEETYAYLSQELCAQLLWDRLSQEECDARLKKYNVTMTGPVHAVLTISLGGEIPPRLIGQALAALQAENLLVAESHNGGHLVALYSGTGGARFADAMVSRILARLDEIGGFHVRIGVGQTCERLIELRRSFVESVAALRHDALVQVNYFDELVETGYEYENRPMGFQRLRLVECIRQGDAAAVEQACDELCAELTQAENRMDPAVVQFTAGTLVSDLLPVFREVKLNNVAWKINLAVHAVRPDTMLGHLKPLCVQAAQAFANRHDTWINKRADDILRYVDERYDDSDLSLNSIAMQFNMTPSSLSRLFSESTGMRFIDYISQKRMTQATVLLTGTGLPVSEIMRRVGYLDASSFTRKFTKMYGLSPSAYRKQAQSASEEK